MCIRAKPEPLARFANTFDVKNDSKALSLSKKVGSELPFTEMRKSAKRGGLEGETRVYI